jgi:drug/metabolite transporter (DMT)-like permease
MVACTAIILASPQRPLNLRSLLLLTVLAAIWGGSFLFIRMAVNDFGVAPLTTTRSVIAALALTPFALLQGHGAALRQYWWQMLILGLISTALPFSFLAISTQYTSAGFASLLNAFTPVFSALIAWLWLQERLNFLASIGIALSFCGLVVLVLAGEDLAFTVSWLPIAVGLAATFCYGLTGNFSRKFLPGTSPLVIAAGSQIAASLWLLPVAFWQWPPYEIQTSSWLLAAVLGLLCTGVAYIIYFHLLATIGVARTVIVTYLSPVFAMLWGYMFLREQVNMTMLVGATIIMLGITLTSYKPK